MLEKSNFRFLVKGLGEVIDEDVGRLRLLLAEKENVLASRHRIEQRLSDLQCKGSRVVDEQVQTIGAIVAISYIQESIAENLVRLAEAGVPTSDDLAAEARRTQACDEFKQMAADEATNQNERIEKLQLSLAGIASEAHTMDLRHQGLSSEANEILTRLESYQAQLSSVSGAGGWLLRLSKFLFPHSVAELIVMPSVCDLREEILEARMSEGKLAETFVWMRGVWSAATAVVAWQVHALWEWLDLAGLWKSVKKDAD